MYMYENFGIKENIWCDIFGFDQSEQMNIKLMLHSVWKFWQIAINSIARKSLICLRLIKQWNAKIHSTKIVKGPKFSFLQWFWSSKHDIVGVSHTVFQPYSSVDWTDKFMKTFCIERWRKKRKLLDDLTVSQELEQCRDKEPLYRITSISVDVPHLNRVSITENYSSKILLMIKANF